MSEVLVAWLLTLAILAGIESGDWRALVCFALVIILNIGLPHPTPQTPGRS